MRCWGVCRGERVRVGVRRCERVLLSGLARAERGTSRLRDVQKKNSRTKYFGNTLIYNPHKKWTTPKQKSTTHQNKQNYI